MEKPLTGQAEEYDWGGAPPELDIAAGPHSHAKVTRCTTQYLSQRLSLSSLLFHSPHATPTPSLSRVLAPRSLRSTSPSSSLATANHGELPAPAARHAPQELAPQDQTSVHHRRRDSTADDRHAAADRREDQGRHADPPRASVC